MLTFQVLEYKRRDIVVEYKKSNAIFYEYLNVYEFKYYPKINRESTTTLEINMIRWENSLISHF